MKRLCLILSLAAALAPVGLAGCERKPPKTASPPAKTSGNPSGSPARESWSAQDIAGDPQGYLVWSNAKVAEQIAEREKKLSALSLRRGDWEKRRDGFEENLRDLENIRRRLGEAYQRADDEDRWPVRFADRSLSRDKALAALETIGKHLEEYTPDRKVYNDVLARMDQAADAYRNDIRQLTRLRQKMEADLEQVRLTQDLAKAQELRDAEQQLAAMSRAAVSITDDPIGRPALKTPPAKVNIDDILKP